MSKYKITSDQQIVLVFLCKVIFIFTIWKLLYWNVLEPTRFFDKPLTNYTANSSASVIGFIHNKSNISTQEFYYADKNAHKVNILIDSRKVLGIADPCNALELYILYIAFFLCYPIFRIKKVFKFVVIGSLTIFLLNILRCVIIAELNLGFHLGLSDLAHHYLFKIFVYGIIFFMWTQYLSINKINTNEN